MARHVPTKVDAPRAVMARVGKQILEVVTAGMYNDPRMALREYIQNAADSIDAAIAGGAVGQAKAKIQIEIDGCARTITILDNGAVVKERDGDNKVLTYNGVYCIVKNGVLATVYLEKMYHERCANIEKNWEGGNNEE